VIGLYGSWDDLAISIGAKPKDIQELKKTANIDLGVRHATKTGTKMRADPFNYGTWMVALFQAIDAARERLELGYKQVRVEDIYNATARAMAHIPFE
jgi:hypothetical protein